MDLNEAKIVLHENGLKLVDNFLNEDSSDNLVYTGLLYGDGTYAHIISRAIGQITDGIGEGSGRTSAIFRHYYEDLVGAIHVKNDDGELALTKSSINYIQDLISCIWRVASIERKDKRTEERNIYYEYLDANWYDICKLQHALQKMNDYSLPMSDEEKQKKLDKINLAKEKAAQKAKEEAEQAEQKKQAEINDRLNKVESVLNQITPDAKDEKRAEDAWYRYNKDFYSLFYKGLVAQLKKITDKNKKMRRIAAFYYKIKEKTTPEDFANCFLRSFTNLSQNPDYYS